MSQLARVAAQHVPGITAGAQFSPHWRTDQPRRHRTPEVFRRDRTSDARVSVHHTTVPQRGHHSRRTPSRRPISHPATCLRNAPALKYVSGSKVPDRADRALHGLSAVLVPAQHTRFRHNFTSDSSRFNPCKHLVKPASGLGGPQTPSASYPARTTTTHNHRGCPRQQPQRKRAQPRIDIPFASSMAQNSDETK